MPEKQKTKTNYLLKLISSSIHCLVMENKQTKNREQTRHGFYSSHLICVSGSIVSFSKFSNDIWSLHCGRSIQHQAQSYLKFGFLSGNIGIFTDSLQKDS